MAVPPRTLVVSTSAQPCARVALVPGVSIVLHPPTGPVPVIDTPDPALVVTDNGAPLSEKKLMVKDAACESRLLSVMIVFHPPPSTNCDTTPSPSKVKPTYPFVCA